MRLRLLALAPLALLACGPNQSDRRPERVPLSAEGKAAKSQGSEVRDALAPIHAAASKPPPREAIPCPLLEGKALNVSWARLDTLHTGKSDADPRGILSGDPASFNDDVFADALGFAGKGLSDASERDLERIAKASARLGEVRYVRVAKTVDYQPPVISLRPGGDPEQPEYDYEPGSARAWLRVFDREGALVCAVEASATNREGLRLGPKRGQKGGADPLDVAKARLAVDLGERLSGALRRAARPSADSTSHLETEPSSCAVGSDTGECEGTETGTGTETGAAG
ncbi:hypothetical protein PPSIR1_14470 [Plesiocystis pacifica SIR-1]|uniref:Lipoprotein n=1 Tax=Plesiocystis pacifica SIR-1 TaxID=391625 RepID=A6GJH2_9BACT|nr:hypothetical protein [Plesiocystis pacifica]EDM73987.1 hypothetical protein PPSIR1_14470 [Plesiocystis pacifica SIR-1]